MSEPDIVTDLQTLEQIYGEPAAASRNKEIDYLHPLYQAFIRAAPFAMLATSGPGGLDASPRGDGPGFIHIEDAHTLLLPDRRGNNRVDSLRNIVADPRVALLLLVPGVNETLRVNGRAQILVTPSVLARFAVDGKAPRSVLRIHVESVYFQCSRALLRSALWDPTRQIARSTLPSAGSMLAGVSTTPFDGAEYDANLAERVKNSLY